MDTALRQGDFAVSESGIPMVLDGVQEGEVRQNGDVVINGQVFAKQTEEGEG